VQQAVELIFAKVAELGSARQALLWFRREKVSLPKMDEGSGQEISWKLPVYNTIWKVLRNPMYAGAYAFGKTESRTKVVDGRARKTDGHVKPIETWMVLLRDHHAGYISWEQFERNQAMLGDNAHMKSRMEPKAGRGGRSLLAGLLRCRRCGRMLHVAYSGTNGNVPRYHCRGAQINHGEDWCISFGGLGPDHAVATEIVKAVEGNAVEAALEAATRVAEQQQQRRHAWSLELEQAKYEAHLAARRYEAVDPDNRLVAAELEARWNVALQTVADLESRLRKDEVSNQPARIPDRETLGNLAHDLAAVWNLPTTDMRLKQRIVRILISEIVADVDPENQQIILLIHWVGGQHSELRVKKNATGKHSRCTSLEAIEIIRRMAGKFPDDQIASTLNRLGLKTGAGNTWREGNVRTVRSYHQLPAFTAAQCERNTLTMEEASMRLSVSHKIVRRLIDAGKITATQVVPCAPWEIPAEAIESQNVLEEIKRIKQRARPLRATSVEDLPMFAER
jgi:excisionase family DNA binding protein